MKAEKNPHFKGIHISEQLIDGARHLRSFYEDVRFYRGITPWDARMRGFKVGDLGVSEHNNENVVIDEKALVFTSYGSLGKYHDIHAKEPSIVVCGNNPVNIVADAPIDVHCSNGDVRAQLNAPSNIYPANGDLEVFVRGGLKVNRSRESIDNCVNIHGGFSDLITVIEGISDGVKLKNGRWPLNVSQIHRDYSAALQYLYDSQLRREVRRSLPPIDMPLSLGLTLSLMGISYLVLAPITIPTTIVVGGLYGLYRLYELLKGPTIELPLPSSGNIHQIMGMELLLARPNLLNDEVYEKVVKRFSSDKRADPEAKKIANFLLENRN